jgi:hypothetical protein
MAENEDNEQPYSPEEPFNMGPMVNMASDPYANLMGSKAGLISGAPAATSPAAQAPQTGAVPASASRTGKASPDMVQAALKQGIDALTSAPDQNEELAKEEELEKKLQADQAQRATNLRDPSGKLQPQYKPTGWQKFGRGVEGAALGLAEGGLRGAIAGGINPDLTNPGKGYGDPNRAGQQELGRESATVAADQQSLSELKNRFKEAQESAYGKSKLEDAVTRAERAEAAANKPGKEPTTQEAFTIQTAKLLYPDNPEAQQKYIDDHGATGRLKGPTNYESTVIAAQNEKEPNGPLHRAAQEMRDTEIKKFKASNSGRQPTDTELWNQAFKTEYGRAPNAEEIASRKVSGGGLAGEAAGRPGKTQDRTAFDAKWNSQFNTMEKKYDARKNAIDKDPDMGADQKKAQLQQIEAERESEKLGIQNEKDKAAEQSGVYSGQPTAPTGNAPRPAPQNNQNKLPSKADIPNASEARRNPSTGEEAYKINGKWYRASQLK